MKMEMQVMIERLLTGEAKAEADRKADRENLQETMKTNQDNLLKNSERGNDGHVRCLP
jgi:hypothetical protein